MRILSGRLAASFAIFILSSQPGLAQQSPDRPSAPLVTDRPDYTESSEVVGRGLFQFESGFNYEVDRSGGVKTRSVAVPGALLRVGLSSRVELRIGGDGFLSDRTGGLRASGHSDLELGIKVRLLDQQRAGLDVAIIPMASLPTGTTGFTSGAVDPTLKITWARDLPAGFGLTGNVNAASVSDDAGRFRQGAFSASLGHDLPGGFGGYIEAYSFTPMSRGDRTGVTVDGGISRQFAHTVQFDVEVGRGVTASAPDWFVGFGFAIRSRR